MKSIRKQFSAPRSPKLPLTKAMIHQFLDHLYQPTFGIDGQQAPLTLWRTIWRITIEYFTLGQFSDVISLTTASLQFRSDPSPHLLIQFANGKNDLFHEGSERVVPSSAETPKYCPVCLTRLYLLRLGNDYSGYLIPRCSPRSGSMKPTLPNPAQPLSYCTALEDFRNLLSSLGYDPMSYGEHSGKRGGASEAASAGLSLPDLQRLGGWRSQTMPAKYTDVPVAKRIRLASSLL